jgi:outer membrane protein assembly factor BamB
LTIYNINYILYTLTSLKADVEMISDNVDENHNHNLRNAQWLICPVCKQPNPAGTLFCTHCWGASLYTIKPITYEEVADFTKRQIVRTKRRRIFRTALIVLIPLLILFGLAFGGIYTMTDLVFAPQAQLNSNSLPSEWSMFHHDLSRSGSTDINTIQPQGKLKWSFQTDGEVNSSPAVANGMVYFGSTDYKLYAIDASTGEEQWVFQAGSWIDSSPAVVDGIVYFGSNDGKLYAVDAKNGSKLWDFETSYAIRSSPAIVNGMVIFGSNDYSVYALNAKTGKKMWRFKTNGYVTSSPVIANGIVYFGSTDGSCYALDARNGRFRLNYHAFSLVLSPPAVDNGVVYFTNSGILYALDGKARNWPYERYLRPLWIQLWAFHIAPTPPPISGPIWQMGLVINPNATRLRLVDSSDGAPIVTDSNIYTTGDNLVYSIDKTTHKFQWIFKTEDNIESSPSVANNVLYIGSNDGKLYAIDAKNGTKLWDFATGGKISSSPAFADGVIYFGSNDGKLYAIE